MHRLQQFVVGILVPELNTLTHNLTTKQTAWAAMNRAVLTETLLWLHLGVEVGVFPEQASRDVYQVYLVPFFKSLLSREKEEREKMRRGEIYVAHSAESEALRYILPRYAGILVEKAMRDEEIFSVERSGFDNPLSLRGLFQCLLILYSHFATSPSARRLTYEINFVSQDTWKQDWNEDCRPEDVIVADDRGSDSAIALTLAGYLGFWRFGSRVQAALENIEGREGLSATDFFRFRDRIREIHGWRINLRSAETLKRFEQITQRIGEGMERQTRKEDGIDPRCANLIQKSMESSFEFAFGLAYVSA